MSSLRVARPAPQPVLWKEREDGLLEYCGPTDKPAVVDAWRKLDAEIDVDIWAEAAIAASVTTVYGREDMLELAEGVEKHVSYIRRMAKTFRYYTQKETRVSFSNIYFKHHSLSLRHPEPRKALLKAAENGWSCSRFQEWISEQKGGPGKREKPFTDLDRSQRSEYLRSLKLRIELEVEDCPYKEYKGMLSDLIEAIDWDIYQLGFGEAERKVKEAIEQGQANIKQIVRFTHLKEIEVSKVVGKLVGDEDYEWVTKPKTTDVARGSAEKFLQRVEEKRQVSHHDPNAGYNSADFDEEEEEHF